MKTENIMEKFALADIEITPAQAEKFALLCDFMLEYNQNVNLTAITDPEQVVIKHFVDSVLPFSMLKIEENSRFIDVGTGAGFPSLPLLIWRADLRGTLLDSLQKRCVYLEKACEKLSINAEIIHGRGEDVGRLRREMYDFSCARAVAPLPVLAEYCVPFVRVGGRFIALKSVSEDAACAENALGKLGAELEKSFDYALPNGDARRLVVAKKLKKTPDAYPRPSAKIKKQSL